jgi:pilus assembly protein Flp/PilA
MMKSLLRSAVRFLRAEDGPTAVEYAMLMMLILLACITAIMLFGQSTSHSFDRSDQQIRSAIDGR